MSQKPNTLFLSHGAPDLGLHESPARAFLQTLGKTLGRPPLIVVASAHFEAPDIAVVADPAPRTLYDFGGFDRRLHEMTYPAPGAPEAAEAVAVALQEEGLTARGLARRGYDHGVWVPLQLIYPEADIPVLMVSVDPRRGAAHHIAAGRAIRKAVGPEALVIGSGSMTHDLASVFTREGLAPRLKPAPAWVTDFSDWVTQHVEAGDVATLSRWEEAPHARDNHPTPEHFLPFFTALGAAGERAGTRIHTSPQYGALMMDVVAWEQDTEALAA
ncbi:MAG: dioxygenase [Hyphomicrobiaceae bacterium]|nr:dioxygenase [Hyphomicrobiaceae bacterium]